MSKNLLGFDIVLHGKLALMLSNVIRSFSTFHAICKVLLEVISFIISKNGKGLLMTMQLYMLIPG